eukprot:tig00021728_g23307.t1
MTRGRRGYLGRPVRLLVVGVGQRGENYALYAAERPGRALLVGIADPRAFRRERVLREFANQDPPVDPDQVFTDWREAAARPKFADAVIIATQDSDHVEPAVAFARLGYDIFLEKPMALTESDCGRIVDAVKEAGVFLSVAHVMRYTPYSRELRDLAQNAIGEVVSVQHLEPIGHWHYAHSYVRGNWRRSADTTCALLAKSCHDLDYIRYIVGKRCRSVSSFGSLRHFRADNKPEGAADRCADCPPHVEGPCPYSARKVYMDPLKGGYDRWPVSVALESGAVAELEPASEPVERLQAALRDGPYGRCVYACDNDVVDNQVVNCEFEDGSTASFSMIAFTEEVCVRKTRVCGTRGELVGDGRTIRHYDFSSGQSRTLAPESDPTLRTRLTGHDMADYYIVHAFIEACLTGDPSHSIDT